jgi:hypothetical protein
MPHYGGACKKQYYSTQLHDSFEKRWLTLKEKNIFFGFNWIVLAVFNKKIPNEYVRAAEANIAPHAEAQQPHCDGNSFSEVSRAEDANSLAKSCEGPEIEL